MSYTADQRALDNLPWQTEDIVRKAWPPRLPSPSQLMEYDLARREWFVQEPGASDLVWIEYGDGGGGWNSGWAALCYWPDEGRSNKPIRINFRSRTAAYEWYAINVTDTACRFCFDKPRNLSATAPWDDYCDQCAESIRTLRDLRRRVQEQETRWKRMATIQDEIDRLRERLGESDFTLADKADVLDRILATGVDCMTP